jgi:hypothetical protein
MIFIVWQVDLSQIQIELSINFWLFFCLATVITLLNNLFAAYRLQAIIPGNLKILHLTRLNFIGTFFSAFMPTNFGGDIFRVRFLKPKLKDYSQATAVVFIDRFVGLTALLVFALLALLYTVVLVGVEYPVYIYLLIVLFASAAVVVWTAIISDTFLRLVNRFYYMDKLNETNDYIKQISAKEYFIALAWAFLIQFNSIVFNILLGQAAGIDIPLYFYFIFIPITNLLLIIPITVNGIGLRDVLFLNLFAIASASANIVLLGPLNVLANIFNAAIGAMIYATTDREKLWIDRAENTAQQL